MDWEWVKNNLSWDWVKSIFDFRNLITSIEAIIRGYFVDTIWKIDRHLYQSGDLDDKSAPFVVIWRDLDAVLDLEGEIDPPDVLKELKKYWHLGIPDGPLPWDPRVNKCTKDEWWALIDEVNKVSLAGINTLVHCGAGRNRASLATGCIMYRRGLRGDAIVEYIRKKRPSALSNQIFVEYLRSLN